MSNITSGNRNQRIATILMGAVSGIFILLIILMYGTKTFNWFGFETNRDQSILAYQDEFKVQMAKELEVGSHLQNVTVEKYFSKPYGYYYLFIKLSNGQPARAVCVFQSDDCRQPQLWCSPNLLPFPSPIN